MSTYYYLARKDNKSLFELGKGGNWFNNNYSLKSEKIIEHNYEEHFPLKFINRIDIENYVVNGLNVDFDNLEEFDLERVKNLSDKIEKFCSYQIVYLLFDVGDLFFELKREHGFKEIDSRYCNFEPEI